MSQLIIQGTSLEDFLSQINTIVINAIENKKESTSTEIELKTRKVTAKKLGISLPTLNSYTKKGIITAYRIGSQIRYKSNEIEEALQKIQFVKYGRV
jgi:excisionase family DNA binding protein